MKLQFFTPASGDWLVIVDEDNGVEIYSGHGHGDQIYDILRYAKITHEWTELPDEDFEDRFV